MEISFNEKYLQIALSKDSPILAKVIIYANKHFNKRLKLSNSIIILDAEERRKKDYLITWAYHATLQDDLELLDAILKRTNLPIRIKMIGNDEMLHVVKVTLSQPSLSRAILHLDTQNFVAKRYLCQIFKEYYLSECHLQSGEIEIVLDSSKEGFYKELMNVINYKVIHNVVLDFDFTSFQDAPSFLTAREIELQKVLTVLNSRIDESFEAVKKRYLSLAREYHPDKVYSKDKELVRKNTERFQEIVAAYERFVSLTYNEVS